MLFASYNCIGKIRGLQRKRLWRGIFSQQIVHPNFSHAFEQVCLERGAAFGEALDFFADGFAVACFREFASASELADVCVFGVGDDFAFFAVAERADDAARIFLVRDHGWHAAELAFVQHVHQ